MVAPHSSGPPNSSDKFKIKPRKPEPYSGDRSVDAFLWIEQMESYLKLSNTNQTVWVEFAVTFLDKDAAQWWRSHKLATGRTNPQFCWIEFTHLFLERFQPVAASKVAYSCLKRWKQTNTVESYIEGFLDYQLISRTIYFQNSSK